MRRVRHRPAGGGRGRGALLVESVDAPFVLSDVAVVEVVFALCRHYEFSRTAAAEAIEGLMSLTQVDCNRALSKRALPLFTDQPKLSFEDCCMAAYAELPNAEPVWTFDTKLAGQAPSARLVPAWRERLHEKGFRSTGFGRPLISGHRSAAYLAAIPRRALAK